MVGRQHSCYRVGRDPHEVSHAQQGVFQLRHRGVNRQRERVRSEGKGQYMSVVAAMQAAEEWRRQREREWEDDRHKPHQPVTATVAPAAMQAAKEREGMGLQDNTRSIHAAYVSCTIDADAAHLLVNLAPLCPTAQSLSHSHLCSAPQQQLRGISQPR